MSRRYVTQVRVRWSDLDAFRHVNNAKTVTLLEEARVDWLFSEAARHGVDRLTDGIVVARLEIDYKRPIGMELPVTVSMGLTKLGQASMTVDYLVSVAGTTMATASSVLVPVDPVTFRPRRLDDREKNFLAQYLAPEHDAAAAPGTTNGLGGVALPVGGTAFRAAPVTAATSTAPSSAAAPSTAAAPNTAGNG